MVATEWLLRNVSLAGFSAGQGRSSFSDDSDPVDNEEYHPFGTTAWWASSGSTDVGQKRYRHTAKEKDEETGLGQHGVRSYCAWLGRWERVDPIGFNRWAYCRGNPISRSDAGGTRDTMLRGSDADEIGQIAQESFKALRAGRPR